MDRLKQYRLVGFLEGISYILLLGIAVPVKYIGGNDLGVKLLGMPHGILFMAYIAYSIHFYDKQNWKTSLLFYAFLASLLPFGTIYFDLKVLKPLAQKQT
ncbi:MAG: DUF3817 domain-containing protein [Saprospiraceae bacterium]|nr:DUF3817 domain-containing protein [Saprospiraceae bacterium]